MRIVVGGSEAGFERCRPVLEVLGEPTYMGPLGAGAAAKLVNNLAGIGAVALLAEALALGDRLGLDPTASLEMLATSHLSAAVGSVAQRVERQDFTPQFKAALAEKDLRLAVEAGESHGADLRIASAARSWFADAVAANLGDRDWSVVTSVVRQDGGEWLGRSG